MLPNLQTKSNDRMLVTRIQPGPFSGYDSATRKTIVGSNGIKKMLACTVEAGPKNLFYPSRVSWHIQHFSVGSHQMSACAGIPCSTATFYIMRTPAAQQWHSGEHL